MHWWLPSLGPNMLPSQLLEVLWGMTINKTAKEKFCNLLLGQYINFQEYSCMHRDYFYGHCFSAVLKKLLPAQKLGNQPFSAGRKTVFMHVCQRQSLTYNWHTQNLMIHFSFDKKDNFIFKSITEELLYSREQAFRMGHMFLDIILLQTIQVFKKAIYCNSVFSFTSFVIKQWKQFITFCWSLLGFHFMQPEAVILHSVSLLKSHWIQW